jgi:hypothetical protein
MGAVKITRRKFYLAAAATAAGAIGCDSKPVQKAGGDALTAVGTVLVLVPHGVVKIVGAFFILVGATLRVEAELADGTRKEVDIKLTEEQVRRLKSGEKPRLAHENGERLPQAFVGDLVYRGQPSE